jgi:DNA-directed RNA polymerase subunit beta
MNKIFVNNIGDLAEIQRASFYRFLSTGITEELANFPNPFIAKIKVPTRTTKRVLPCFVYLYTHDIKLKGPNYSIDNCLKRDISYTIQLYIPGEYSYSFDPILDIRKKEPEKNLKTKKKINTINQIKSLPSKKIRVKQDIFFGEIPLMTEEGTFIISGCERIVISQIIRSPGVYFKKEFSKSGKTSYTATIISNRGLWTKFILDTPKSESKAKQPKAEKDRIYMKLNDFKSNSSSSEEKLKKKEKDKSDEHKLFIFDLLRYLGLNYQEFQDNLFYAHYSKDQQLMRDPRKVSKIVPQWPKVEIPDLIRKFFFNEKVGHFSIGEIGRYKVNKQLGLNLPKEITYLTLHDFLGIIDGLLELKYDNRPSDDIDHIKNKQIRSVGELLQNTLRVGFYRLQKNLAEGYSAVSTSQKLNFDLEPSPDPEDWLLDPRPVTIAVKEFFKTSQLSQFMDQVNPLAELTHKRRISVFGPNGVQRDHISPVIRDIQPSQYGRLCPIETPEGQNAGLIMSLALFGRVGSLGWIETPYFVLEKQKLYCNKQPIFLNPELESVTKVAFADIQVDNQNNIQAEYLSVKEDYSFSVEKQSKINLVTTSPLQIISLATALIPFVEHDDANRALMGSNMQRQAVPLIYSQKPIIGTGLEATAILDSGMVIKNYCEGKVFISSANIIAVDDVLDQRINYYLRKYYRSNQETAINQRPVVWPGEMVFSGQIIADGPSTNDGELSLGRNLTIGYMPWEGYNYEDAIVINERIIYEDCLTSIHIEEHETNLSYSVTGSEKLTNNLPHLTTFIRRHLDEEGIVKIGSYVKEHDILVGKLTPCDEDTSPEAKLLKALYGQKKPSFRDTSLKVAHGTEGRVIDVRIISTNLLSKDTASFPSFSETIRIYIAQVRKIQVGDKLAGRHGNKGIISRILPAQDMPYLPDGTPIDIIFNPLGVPSRMNVGQVLECLLGLAGQKLGNRFKVSPFDEIYGKEASRILVNQKLKEAACQTKEKWLFNEYSPGKILLRDGRTGEYFDNPITVGKSYILKLIHLVEDKIHARATGPYSMITEQPLAGKSQKGGQRFGEMEVWALEAYGCSHTLQELLTIKSDDIDGRNDMYEAILVRKEVDKPTPSIPEAFLALVRELQSLGLDFTMNKFENGFYSTTDISEVELDIFQAMEKRLEIRALLARKKAEEFTKFFEDLTDPHVQEKADEKQRLLRKIERHNWPEDPFNSHVWNQ